MSPKKVNCHHCNEFVSRRTATRHKNASNRSKELMPNRVSSLTFLRDRSTATDGSVFCNHCSKFVTKRTLYKHSVLSSQNAPQKRTVEEDSGSGHSESEDDWPQEQLSPQCDVRDDEQSAFNRILPTDDDKVHSDNTDQKHMDEYLENVTASDSEGMKACDTDVYQEPDSFFSQSSDEDVATGTVVWDDITADDIASDIQQPHERTIENKYLVRADQIVKWIFTSLLSLQRQYFISTVCIEKFFILIHQILSLFQPVSSLCSAVLNIFPRTIHAAWKYLQIDRDNFSKYIVCPNCNSLHLYDSVIRFVDGSYVASKCDNKVFSCRVAGSSSRKKGKFKCDAELVREVQLKGGKSVLYPLKFYCYKGLIDNLEQFLLRPQFVERCNLWRSRRIPPNFYADVFDGKVWKNFIEFNGSDFLTRPYHFGVMLNVDWFQPHDRRRDISVGALYMVFMNLPREERFKSENAMLIGLIPALSKEPDSLNSFLDPLVTELKIFWNGILMTVPGYADPVLVKVALMCAAADIPAARKLCGFLGHGAIQGCSFCTKPQRLDGEPNCGIPDLAKWPLRNRTKHLKWTKKALSASCLTQLKEIEKDCGYRFTSLLNLHYFEPSLMTVVDPMHNLFLGTAKKMFSHWVESELISKTGLSEISGRIDSIKVSSDIGSIPKNIATNYGQMNAKEWKNWVLVYSLYCLKGVLPMTHLRIWQTFVLACRHLCQPCISTYNVNVASKLLITFCKRVQDMYGTKFVTPNMHLHCHLHESIQNFGSLYGFWLFGFERYNGILGDFPTNKRCVEVQMMRKFLMFSVLDGNGLENEYRLLYDQVCQLASSKVNITTPEIALAHSLPIHEVASSVWSDMSLVSFKDAGYTVHSFTKDEVQNLIKTYEYIYQKSVSSSMLSSFFHKYSTIQYGNVT